MFCLRSWLCTLLFLTNASPIYVFLFLTATFMLQRPCVYCSILLFVLVFSLFDFRANWFESAWESSSSMTETAGSLLSGNATFTEALEETASIALSTLRSTGGSLANMSIESVKRRVSGGHIGTPTTTNGFEWLRGILEKRQLRIPCVDVLIRL